MFDSVLALTSETGLALSYTSTQRLACSQARVALPPLLASYGLDALDNQLDSQQGSVDATMTVSIPGALTDRWLEAPGERERQFFPVYAKVSRAVQRAMRTWLPYLYFGSLERYEDLAVAAPLVVYQASRPCAGRPKYDFSYDVLSEASMTFFYRGATKRLVKEMARIEGLLRGAGRRDLAEAYRPRQARVLMKMVRRHPERVRSLLVADSCLTDAFVNLGCQAGRLRNRIAEDPKAAGKELARLADQAARSLRATLRRLPGGQDSQALAALLFVEATNALGGDATRPSGIQATLHISAN
jgi:hypothetical protein